MSLRPCSGEQVPPLTAQVARASNPGGTTAIWVRDRLDGLWCDEDFVDWYPRDGRPGLSPAQLAAVCVLQFLLGLSDRQAAEAVRCRIDFKYAMAMELDDPGFHHSVLADFRDRLAEGDRADRLLDLALARLKEAGLVRERTTQRTDSTHVLAAVRDLTRLELITQAVRAALEEVAGISPHLLDELVDEDWGRRYGRPVRLGTNPALSVRRVEAVPGQSYNWFTEPGRAGVVVFGQHRLGVSEFLVHRVDLLERVDDHVEGGVVDAGVARGEFDHVQLRQRHPLMPPVSRPRPREPVVPEAAGEGIEAR